MKTPHSYLQQKRFSDFDYCKKLRIYDICKIKHWQDNFSLLRLDWSRYTAAYVIWVEVLRFRPWIRSRISTIYGTSGDPNSGYRLWWSRSPMDPDPPMDPVSGYANWLISAHFAWNHIASLSIKVLEMCISKKFQWIGFHHGSWSRQLQLRLFGLRFRFRIHKTVDL